MSRRQLKKARDAWARLTEEERQEFALTVDSRQTQDLALPSPDFLALHPTEQAVVVWNNAMTRVVRPLEAVNDAHIEIEILIEKIRMLVPAAAEVNRITHTAISEALRDYSARIAEWLAYADPFNRELGALAQKLIDPHHSPYYIDFTYAQQLYNACQDFINRVPKSDEALFTLLEEDRDTRRRTTISEALKPRQRDKVVDYAGIYEQMENLRHDEGLNLKYVTDAATWMADNIGEYDAETYRRYFNKEAARRKRVMNKG